MKKYYFLIVLALILGLVLTGCSLLSNVGQVPASEQSGVTYLTKSFPNLVGLWHFDEGVGVDPVVDSSGYGNNGNVFGATTGVAGKFGNALSFDGVDDYVSILHSTSLDISSVITVEAWVKADTLGSQNAIIRKGLWLPAVIKSWGLDIQQIGGVKKARFFIYDGATAKIAYSGAITAGTWHHLAGTYDGAKVDIYLDGSNALSTSATHVGDIDTNTEDIVIGMRKNDCFFDGLIDEVRIWNIARTEFQLEPVVVAIDIKPGSCPNPLNVKSQGVLPVAILGTESFDVTQVDPATVKLEGVAPLRWAIEDVATPSVECNTFGPDGYLDLTLKFDTQEILVKLKLSTSDLIGESEIVLSDLEDGESLMLTLTGYLYDGTPILGEDTVLIIKKGK